MNVPLLVINSINTKQFADFIYLIYTYCRYQSRLLGEHAHAGVPVDPPLPSQGLQSTGSGDGDVCHRARAQRRACQEVSFFFLLLLSIVCFVSGSARGAYVN